MLASVKYEVTATIALEDILLGIIAHAVNDQVKAALEHIADLTE